MPLPRLLRLSLLILASLLCVLAALIYSLTWHPAAREAAPVSCQTNAPQLQPGQALKVMTWNIQYLAGKRYVFWYDLADGSGPDQRPSAEDLAFTLDEVARILRDEQPDIVLLQELHNGAKATDYQNQLALLHERLSDLYPCSSQAYYWKAALVPHPQILGSVGMQLGTLSRFQISRAERLQLPLMPADPISRQFNLKRALLVSHLPVRGGGELVAINTHLDAFAQGNDTMQRQVAMTSSLLDQLQADGTPWVIGGDFNLLPPGQYQRLPASQRSWYSPNSELQQLAERYPMVPSLEQANGAEQARWYTHYPNDPAVRGPDRTLDYLFHSPQLTLLDSQVRQHDSLGISDHLPVLARLLLPTPD
ncbi:endonuclease/exonuclease/phosphatase family protein [Pseudomonas anguilliseptica]|uniref:Metal-dependent hydrolase, endonuclease/exonuclease/phosphatase family n=1 Tax=Pseudomonas anguilliseptica TaxID=53406 RepID=A0A1H5AYG2_PSEAG|nr:endonuclease/exonuclease/phosphatase family protein [Pseudomonas anguilliseptica]SED47373.1 Metal-dependent hydrolase, endonuclease/exonuclease/phosphatase family [Pseudomonas anguilliseptica]